ncbi:MAG TPA: Ig-like domain-containing protein [Methylomirabilota bacterium]|nr:Ig-like domain-containing protein [Methylomirabilota bacterium]
MRRHRAITRTLIAALSLALAAAVSAGGAAQAGLTTILPAPASILPAAVGMGIGTSQAVSMPFDHAMDAASVEGSFSIAPAHAVHLVWSDDGRELRVVPDGLWSPDTRYAVIVGADARTASGALLGSPARFSFTTQTAPRITDFGLHFVAEPAAGAAALGAADEDAVGPPPDTASGVSAGTSIQIAFSAPMNRGEVERAFVLSPGVPGTFHWDGSMLTFTPSERLVSDARYAVSLLGVHDLAGNPLRGNATFSFTTRPGAQLVQSNPKADEKGINPKAIGLWFSQPVDPTSVTTALRVSDRNTGALLTGKTSWNSLYTQLTFTPDRALTGGHRFDVSLADGALDADGNALTAGLTFVTKAPVVARARVSVGTAGPASTLVGYALNQVNAARSAYGLPPLALSSALSAVANEHSWDMLRNNYFSHTSIDGRTKEDRLNNAGISYGWNGENICYSYNAARSPTDVLNWCQSQFMSEPYPGYANHIGNILGTHYHKIGIGIAVSGAKVYITWDFTD